MNTENRDNNTTVLGSGAFFKGELTLKGPTQIFGTIEGQITSEGQVQIANGADCNARVEAATIIVDGDVDGDLIARERLQLTGKAVVKGDISAAALVVAEGATFVGHVAVGPEAIMAADRKRTAQYETKPAKNNANEWSSNETTQTDWASRAVNAA
ncbi:MAG: hypothetical protein RL689_13 [Planctomycetota bacterium]|jgi:cytoskeletal protein CcmA (bactofilin family)